MRIPPHFISVFPAVALGGLAVMGATPAQALSWDFSATFAGDFVGTASGTAITDGSEPVIGSTYTISSVTGILKALGQELPISGPTNYQSATNTFVYNGPGTPIFAAGATGISWSFPFSSFTVNTNLYNPSGPGLVSSWRTSFGQTGTITSSAISPSPTSTPGPLPLMGAAAAFRWGRRLRRHQRNAPSSTTPPGQKLA